MRREGGSERPLRVSVVIPVRNGGASFRQCLSSLVQTAPPPAEMIVVADGDTEDSSCVAREFGAQVVQLPTTGGPARARNIGARIAKGAIVWFVDADVAVHPSAMAHVTGAFAHDPDLAAVFGSYDDAPAAPNFLSQYKNLLHHYVHQSAREEAATFWAGCGAIRREVFLDVGGFDERFRRPSVEDIELGYRLTAAGHKVRLCKALQGKHLKRWTARSLLRADIFDRALPWTALIVRERRLINDLNLRPSGRVSGVLVYGLLAALVAAWWWKAALVVAAALAVGLFGLNFRLYRFFTRKRGLRFASGAIAWHWLYLLYSTLAFAVGVARSSPDYSHG